MNDTDLFWVCIAVSALTCGLVLIDWYRVHQRYAASGIPNLINRTFAFFCLAMLASNVILLARGSYPASLYLCLVISLTEGFFLCTNKVKQ